MCAGQSRVRRSRQIQKPPFPKKVRLRRPDLTALGYLDQSATCKANAARDSHDVLGMGNAPATYAQRQGSAGADRANRSRTHQGLRPSKPSHRPALVLVILSKKSHRVFGEYVSVSFPAPRHFDHMLGNFFARGIGVSRSGELTTRRLNLVPSIIECLRNDFDGLRIKNDRTAREFQNLRHGDPHCRTGGSATGLSAIDAWRKPLSMMAVLCT